MVGTNGGMLLKILHQRCEVNKEECICLPASYPFSVSVGNPVSTSMNISDEDLLSWPDRRRSLNQLAFAELVAAAELACCCPRCRYWTVCQPVSAWECVESDC